MRYSKLTTIFIAFLCAAPGYADDCWICDDEVELTANFAECYTSNFEVLMETFDTKGVGRQQINFAGCSEGDNSTGTRGGLLSMGGLPTNSQSRKTVYTLSRESAVCLKKLIEANEENLDPSMVFRLNEQCSDD